VREPRGQRGVPDDVARLVELATALGDSYLPHVEAIVALRRAGSPTELHAAAERLGATGSAASASATGTRAHQLVRAAFLPSDHLVAFYEHDDFLLASAAPFLRDGLLEGASLLVVATAAHRAAFGEVVAAAGGDLDDPRHLVLDAETTLSRIAPGGVLDLAVLDATVGGWLAAASAGGGAVRVYGEMVALLWEAGYLDTALQLEDGWNGRIASHAFPVLCGYPLAGFGSEEATVRFHDVCARHTGVTTEGYTGLGRDDDDTGPIVLDPAVPGGRPALVGRHGREPELDPRR
jgi:hypothetical protein